VQVPVKPVRGIVIGAFVTVCTTPATDVKVPVSVPTALITPFANVKPEVVRVPVKVPTPAIVWITLVTRPVLPGGPRQRA
jgi:hypothetical protein